MRHKCLKALKTIRTMYSLTFLGLVSLGGAIGASCRYIITIQATQVLGQDFPHGTLVVNIIGSCIMGGLVAAVSNSLLVSDAWRPLIAVGFLGTLTTFSTLSLDNVMFLEQQEYLKAFFNTSLNVIFSISACYLSFYLVSKL